MVVEKRGNQYCTIHCHGEKAGAPIACFPTKEAAERQHRAIETAKRASKIEIDLFTLQKFRRIYVKATATKKAHWREIKEVSPVDLVKETPKEAWKNWQQYFRQTLYRPSLSTHDDYISQAIMIGESPIHVKTLIRRAQAKDPSSMGFDLVADFEQMYRQTKNERL